MSLIGRVGEIQEKWSRPSCHSRSVTSAENNEASFGRVRQPLEHRLPISWRELQSVRRRPPAHTIVGILKERQERELSTPQPQSSVDRCNPIRVSIARGRIASESCLAVAQGCVGVELDKLPVGHPHDVNLVLDRPRLQPFALPPDVLAQQHTTELREAGGRAHPCRRRAARCGPPAELLVRF